MMAKKPAILKKIGENQEVVYDENDVLGRGAFGTVYGGIMNKNINQRVAVKQLNYRGKMLERKNPDFHREIQILSKLDNSYIIKFYFSYIDPKTDQVFIVTERCQSKDLSKQIVENKDFSSQRIFRFAYQLVYAMKYMHQQSCMHRDIKPQNILLTLQDNIKIADLGLAKSILNNDIQSLQLHTPNGTPIYAAPQIIFQQAYSPKCDVWSAGCLIYQLLTKKKFMEAGKTMLLLKRQLEKIKQPVNKANYIGQFKGTFWYKILDQMLTFQDQKRSSFKDILVYFEQENKKHYHINIEGQRQIKGYIEQKQTIKYRANQPKKGDQQKQRQINQQPQKKPMMRILDRKQQQKRPINSPVIEAKTPVVGQGHTRIQIGPIRKLDTHIDNKTLETEDLIVKGQRIEQAKQIFSRAYLLIDFKYQKIKLIYQYLYQFQLLKNYPVGSYFICIIGFLFSFWYKMEIVQFMKQFGGDKYMEFQGKMLTLERIQANKQFLNRRNKILNQLSQKLSKSGQYMKSYIDHIQKKYKDQLAQSRNKYPQLTQILENYKEKQLNAEMACKTFQNILKDYGMPFEKIEQLAPEEKLKIYRLLAALFLLIQKQNKFPDSLLKNNKFDVNNNQKDKMIKKFQELKQMTKGELILIIK